MRKSYKFILTGLIFMVIASVAVADIPHLINIQGFLADDDAYCCPGSADPKTVELWKANTGVNCSGRMYIHSQVTHVIHTASVLWGTGKLFVNKKGKHTN